MNEKKTKKNKQPAMRIFGRRRFSLWIFELIFFATFFVFPRSPAMLVRAARQTSSTWLQMSAKRPNNLIFNQKNNEHWENGYQMMRNAINLIRLYNIVTVFHSLHMYVSYTISFVTFV